MMMAVVVPYRAERLASRVRDVHSHGMEKKNSFSGKMGACTNQKDEFAMAVVLMGLMTMDGCSTKKN